MYFKAFSILNVFGGILLIVSGHCIANDVRAKQVQSLTLFPNKCIALRKGRECFAIIKVKWQTQNEGRYCLRRLPDNLEIKCWLKAKSGSFSYVFNSSTDEKLALVRVEDNRILLDSSVKVSWVYQSNKRRNRWRLF